MAEPVKNRKVSLRDILEEMKEDDAFLSDDRDRAEAEVLELEYKEWSLRQKKLKL